MFRVGEVDVKGLTQFENMLGALGKSAPKVINRALNRTGDMARSRIHPLQMKPRLLMP